ncbi:MAG: valine--tRNA ligase [Patescibacteria group bacterium]|jgi:valyl-tRNA synthetase|nr:valine--tRNA ligase [Patescibacteria group bacterium]
MKTIRSNMQLSKAYEPQEYESTIYELWEKSGAFTPAKGTAKDSISMTLPPPNANANLHMGHALDFCLKDVIARYYRQQGKHVLMLPGADHAGFETWVVYEKKLAAEGKSRFDFSRESLYQQVWDFVALNRGNMENQVRRFGTSCDWSRSTFTLDSNIVNRAYATFKKMWDDGLIYRGERLVNYCTTHRTSFADIEVDYKDQESPLYYLKYGPFELATTRPETKFGDTAVAVHPKDERYKEFVGKVLTVEGVNGPFEIRVIADEMVDREFGTGVVKITPAHDFNDWEAGQRHNLEAIRVINHDGTMNHHAGRFEGMTVLDARQAVVKALQEKGLLVKIDKHYKNRVGVCYKCGTTIEPMLMKQWFVDMQPLAKRSIKALKDNKITFYPGSKKQELINYLEGLKDWNISRQIAWGIPIPAFQNVDDEDDWIYDIRVDQEIISVNGKNYRRDPDVFDTWWSSSQWPYATLNWPDSPDAKQFYPTTLMETGTDLLRQWVSRMINMGLYVTDEVPFKGIYFHGMITDEHGAKMSKSKGNVLFPLDIIDKYGSDALRIGLITGTSAGSNQPFTNAKVVGGRNFCNKLWNIARYCETVLGDEFSCENPKAESIEDHWILNKLTKAQSDIDNLMSNYRVGEALEIVYHTIWDDIADWYIESSKSRPNKQLLAIVLDYSLKMAHPFAPFVTETIWQTLKWTNNTVLMAQTRSKLPKYNTEIATEFNEIKTIITEIRLITTSLGIHKAGLYHKGSKVLSDNADLIKRLAKLGNVAEVEAGKGLHLTTTKLDCWLDIDLHTAATYVTKLRVAKIDKETVIERLDRRLANKNYTDKAPKAVVQQTKDQLEHEKQLLAKLSQELATFESLSNG